MRPRNCSIVSTARWASRRLPPSPTARPVPVLRSWMVSDRAQRFRFAAISIAWSVAWLQSSCHSFGRPYSGTKWLVDRADLPWCCYDAAPNKISAFVAGVSYTTGVTAIAIGSSIGETLILPVDFVARPEDVLPPRPSCNTFWGKPWVAPPPKEPADRARTAALRPRTPPRSGVPGVGITTPPARRVCAGGLSSTSFRAFAGGTKLPQPLLALDPNLAGQRPATRESRSRPPDRVDP